MEYTDIFLKYIKQVISGNGVAIHLLIFVKEFIKSFVQKGTLWQFWYLGALLIIYAILPILSKISCRKKKMLILIRNTSVFRSLVYWGVTLFGATIITWIISKLPIGKYLVKI